MSYNWIKITDRAREGLKIINCLPYDTFVTVLNYVHLQMDADAEDEPPNVGNELEQLEKLVGLPSRPDFLLMIKTFSYVLKRISTFVIKPSRLQADLREKLKFDDDAKIDAILRLWVRNTNPIMDNLASERYESNEVEDVAWKLNVEISSNCQQREKCAQAVLQLRTAAGEDINWEMNHEELQLLYNQFESIQGELDAINSQQQLQDSPLSKAAISPVAATIPVISEK